jgi:hypothetical protein
MKYFLTFLSVISLLISCKPKGDYKAYTSDPVLYSKTVKELNNAVLGNNFPPMIASRVYVYSSIAAYETMAAGNDSFQSLAGQIKHLPALKIPDTTNVDFPFASLLAFCKVGEALTFPEGSMSGYVNQLKNDADSSGMPSEVMEASQVFADSVANHILTWSKGDNYAQTRSAPRYTIIDSPGRWVLTPPMYSQAVEPHWMEVRAMVLDSASQCMPVRPPKFNVDDHNSEFYRALLEVKKTGDSLTEEQKHIADFWDDNPFKGNVIGHVTFMTKKFSPPGHWLNIAGIAAQEANASFEETVAVYAHLSIAMFDAFISCWDEKFRSNYVRPESVINKTLDPEWRPYIQTPPFPSYTSGHATVSAASAEVMTAHFGDQLSFTDTSLLEFGIGNRQIKSFREAAKEAALSRLYGGIHYRFDNEEGAKIGRRIGEMMVNRINLKKRQEEAKNF